MLLIMAVAMLHNTATNKYHPIIFVDYPLPGPHSDEKPERVKSKGHHTEGFVTLEEAVADVATIPGVEHAVIQLDPPILWDGAEPPALVGFIREKKLVFL